MRGVHIMSRYRYCRQVDAELDAQVPPMCVYVCEVQYGHVGTPRVLYGFDGALAEKEASLRASYGNVREVKRSARVKSRASNVEQPKFEVENLPTRVRNMCAILAYRYIFIKDQRRDFGRRKI